MSQSVREDASPRPPWTDAPIQPCLTRNEVHVWRASLRRICSLSGLWAALSVDEQVRAERLTFTPHRDRFVAARGVLRCLLGRYLGREPRRVAFRYGPHGKPELLDDGDDLRFNVAHADDIALYAVARGRDVGVDVERVRPDLAFDTLVGTVLSPAERIGLATLTPERRRQAFFALWTHKEAVAKAVGLGLALEPDQIEIALDQGLAVMVGPAPSMSTPGRWLVRSLNPGPDYAGALAAAADDLLGQMVELQAKTLRVLGTLETSGNHKLWLTGLREARGNIELLAKLTHQLSDAPTVNVAVLPEWASLRALLMATLTPYPEARAAVAASLTEGTGGG